MRVRTWRRKSKRTLNTIITSAFLATQLVVPVSLSGHVFADPPGNNGTFQVHEKGSPDMTPSNEPHVCTFNFEAFGLDANQTGDVNIYTQAPTKPAGTLSLTIPLSTDSNGNGSTSPYVNDTGSAYQLSDGHYMAVLDNKFGTDPGNKAKSKVFWVECAQPVNPTVAAAVTACTVDSGASDTADITVTNPNTAPVNYTVTIKDSHGVTQATQTLSDVENGTPQIATFAGLAPGTYTASVVGDDGTSATSTQFAIANCPYLPAAPTATIAAVPCTVNTNTNDTIDVTVTNTADNTHQTVIYTVKLGGQTKTITLADGASGVVSFSNLIVGSYSASITGNDGTSVTTDSVQVKHCPYVQAPPTATIAIVPCKVNSGDNDTITVTVTNTADNTHQAVIYTVKLGGQTKYITLNDGKTGTVTFSNLAVGSYSAVVTGSDGTVTTGSVTVKKCSTIGYIKVEKHLIPASDSGRFDLNIDGSAFAENVGNNGTTGWVTVNTGKHNVSETTTDGTTDMHNYRSSYVCYKDGQGEGEHPEVFNLFGNMQYNDQWQNPQIVAYGDGTSIGNLQVNKNDKITCVFTNKRLPRITIVKDARPDSSQAFSFDTNAQRGDFTLTDDGSHDGRNHKTFTVSDDHTYYFSEDHTNGWRLSKVSCDGGEWWIRDGKLFVESPNYGDNVTCTFVNVKKVKVTPAAPTFTQPTCDQQLLGQYTIPDTEGVIYKVNGVVTAPGNYPIAAGKTVTVVAYPAPGNYFAPDTQTEWSSTFTAVSDSDCVLGETDVCPNIDGTQATVPDGMTKNADGDCVTPSTTTGGRGEILGASTSVPAELADTGVSTWLGVMAAAMAILTVVGLTAISRRQATHS